jgi:hypothetical protein
MNWTGMQQTGFLAPSQTDLGERHNALWRQKLAERSLNRKTFATNFWRWNIISESGTSVYKSSYSQTFSHAERKTFWTATPDNRFPNLFKSVLKVSVSTLGISNSNCNRATNVRYVILLSLLKLAWVRERTLPTEWPPLVGEDSANVCGWRVPHGQRDGSLRPYCRISRPEPLLFLSSAPQLYSRGWVDPFPYPLLLRKSGSAGNRTRTSGSVARNSDH